ATWPWSTCGRRYRFAAWLMPTKLRARPAKVNISYWIYMIYARRAGNHHPNPGSQEGHAACSRSPSRRSSSCSPSGYVDLIEGAFATCARGETTPSRLAHLDSPPGGFHIKAAGIDGVIPSRSMPASTAPAPRPPPTSPPAADADQGRTGRDRAGYEDGPRTRRPHRGLRLHRHRRPVTRL